jgi:hypothetical protein
MVAPSIRADLFRRVPQSLASIGVSEQHCEAFLTKVVVMRQYVADASLAHRMHRDTIRHATTFVGACFVKGETRHECFMALEFGHLQ